MRKKVYEVLARYVEAAKRCAESGNKEWEERHLQTVAKLCYDYLPHGGGFDASTEVDISRSDRDKLVLVSSFHVMDEYGYYTRWYDFEVVVKPSLVNEIDITVKGKFGRRQDLKDYITDVFLWALTRDVVDEVKVEGEEGGKGY